MQELKDSVAELNAKLESTNMAKEKLMALTKADGQKS